MTKATTALIFIAGLACACSTTSEEITGDDTAVPEETASHDAVLQDTSVFPELNDSAPHDTGMNWELAPDFQPVDLEPACTPGSGCFADPCQQNGDCLSGWCVEHMGDGVCTQLCQEECPPGWQCKAVAAGPDVFSICLSPHPNLCKPCKDSTGCKSTGADDVCVDYADAGAFCGSQCQEDAQCPWGFSCVERETTDGLAVTQCVADAGECPCTTRSVQLALWTPCNSDNEHGSCQGMRVCTDEGLTDCDAEKPDAETCDGIDQDCDGETDEPTLVGGKYLELCDDDNECTADSCLGTQGCLSEPLNQGECGDGDACTVGDHCEDGECVGLPIVCDDKNPCTDDSCDGLGGCKSENNTAKCDDGDPCTVADQCTDAQCAGYALDCECQTDADCKLLDDGDKCNGTLICDTEQEPFRCEVDPASVINCPPAVGPCQTTVCDPETGQCGFEPANQGFACDDGDKCTVGDKCQDGQCAPGVQVNCNDANPCTQDFCNPLTGCVWQDNNLPCNDGDPCTTSDQCQQGGCTPGPALQCDDNNPCTTDSCDPATGCKHLPAQGICEDGNACTVNDYCLGMMCVPGELADCDDENECTADSCKADLGCVHNAVQTPCSDGDPCTVNDQCANSVCVAGPQVQCNDGNPCTQDSCGDAGICLFAAQQGPCSDGNACTIGDHCEAGACVWDQLDNCDDDEICTTDSCHPESGCVHTLNQAPCDDGDVCTLGDHCLLGECLYSGEMNCKDENPCTDDVCHPMLGCLFDANTEPCNDNNACTVDDACQAGKCQPGPAAQCNDDLFCNGVETCDENTGCVPGQPPALDDDLECTVDLCDDDKDKVFHAPDNDLCSNNLYCDGIEICDSLAGCVAGQAPDLDDGVACTQDSCDDVNDVIVHQADNTDCNDQKICTEDICDPQTGCQHNVIGDCGGPHYKLVGEPDPSTVFNSVVETHYYPNNLVNGVWHKPGNKIIVGHSYNAGYWWYDAGATNFGDNPNIQIGSYDRMVHVPASNLLFASTNGHDSPAYNQLFVAPIDEDTGAVGTFQQVQFSDNFTGKCNLMSASPDQFMCWDGSVIRKYDTAEGSNVVTHAGNLALSPMPSDVCSGGCFQGTFAWDGKYYYFATKGSTRYSHDYQVWNADGSFKGNYTAAGSGGIHGAYFDWSSGRYTTHDGWGDRTGGNIHSSHSGLTTDDSQCYSPVSTAHSL